MLLWSVSAGTPLYITDKKEKQIFLNIHKNSKKSLFPVLCLSINMDNDDRSFITLHCNSIQDTDKLYYKTNLAKVKSQYFKQRPAHSTIYTATKCDHW